MAKKEAAATCLGVLALVVSLGILGVAIATLIKVTQKPDNAVEVAPSTTASPSVNEKLNIPQAQPIQPDNDAKFSAYQSAAAYFNYSVQTSADPCNDFYGYVCGSYKKEDGFSINDDGNMNLVATQLDKMVGTTPTSTGLQKLLSFYTTCKKDVPKDAHDALVKDGALIKAKVDKFIKETSLQFTWSKKGSTPVAALPDATNLAKALAYLSTAEGVDTLVSPMVDVDYALPTTKGEGPKGYRFYVDQNTLVYPKSYYAPGAFQQYRKRYEENIYQLFTLYGNLVGYVPDNATIQAFADKIINLELTLASPTYTTDDNTRRDSSRFRKGETTVTDANKQYTFIDWGQYISESLTLTGLTDLVSAPNALASFSFYVMETDTIKTLSDNLQKTPALQGIEPDTIINYLFFRLILANQELLPAVTKTTFHKIVEPSFTIGRQRRGGPRSKAFHRERDPFEPRFLAADVDSVAFACASNAESFLQYALARVFTDVKYPTGVAKANIKGSVTAIAIAIKQGMQTMIDGLDWMDDDSKKGAYAKIRDLLVNVAYPDFIIDNAKLDAYYNDLTLNQANIYDMYDAITIFTAKGSYKKLDSTVTVDRRDFAGPPTTTNAWYQPELNSITFPEGILNKPYFDPDWPSSINLGAMGVIAGHELTHGFDDEGVQWNSKGGLELWMTDKSYKSFQLMAGCVVNEYGSFCPLDASKYTPNCLNGANTQGENIADNGGIHAAYRAYRTHAALNGPDPRLPGGIFSMYNHDQLFFMSFAQVWCQTPETDDQLVQQILRDPHSPAVYRVQGTIRNFPAFRVAFNCPLDSVYAPKDHCPVWVPGGNLTALQPAKSSGPANVPPPEPIQPDQGKPEYKAYQKAVQYFNYSTNTSANPCNDFYGYVCGNYKKEVGFYLNDASNFDVIAAKLDDMVGTTQASTALQKLMTFFTTCKKDASQDAHGKLVNDGKLITAKVKKFAAESGLSFTWTTRGSTPITVLPNAKRLATALAYLSTAEGIDTLVTQSTDVDYAAPKTPGEGPKVYRFYVDQNTLVYPKSYYAPDTFKQYQAQYEQNIRQIFTLYGKAVGNVPDKATIAEFAAKIIDLETTLANSTYSIDDNTRRDYTRFRKAETTASDATKLYTFIDWTQYLAEGLKQTKLTDLIKDPSTYKFYVMEPDVIKTLSDNIVKKIPGFEPDTIVNYLFFRLILANQELLPSASKATFHKIVEPSSFALGRRRRGPGRRAFQHERDPFEPRFVVSDVDGAAFACASNGQDYLQYALARVFTDVKYPTDDAKAKIKSSVGAVAIAIKQGMQTMIDGLDWMDAESKRGAYAKISDLVVNVAYPDFIIDNAQLDKYYVDLAMDPNANIYDLLDVITVWSTRNSYKTLDGRHVDRSDFSGAPTTTNAWYQPELNSITFPEGILNEPYFDPDWPSSINLGAMGVISGHELTHGFDDEGVQWNSQGGLEQWMSDASLAAFKKMAECVVTEYGNFCPLDAAKYTPHCLNGVNTQGENIADNGGIHAAYRAYRNHIALNGPDPRLPDDTFGKYSHDQLFFMSFTQVWCQQPETDDEFVRQILRDPHSPSIYRVLGTIRNFPAFRVAFNCPLNSVYAPQDHCPVWVPSKPL